MRRLSWRWAAAAFLVSAAVVALPLPVNAADLALKRVMLSSGGVGYLEYEAEIDGDAVLSLDVPVDQVDDILKSLVVYDSSGKAGEITLPGREPLAQSFADLPFAREALDSEPDLLNALQGAEIRVAGAKPLTGRIVHVVEETVKADYGPTTTRDRVTLLTDAGLQQFVLQDVDSISFVDPALQQQVRAALSRIAAYRSDGRRRLSIESRGTGHRTVRIGYVVGMPLWKASYRVSVPADPTADKARVQGWAVLENFSGQPWRDVQLTLLSGNPVTFRQALFDSYYVDRPMVPIEVPGRVLPAPDAGEMKVTPRFRRKAAPAGEAEAAAPAATLAAPAPAPEPPPPPPADIDAAQGVEGTVQTAFTLPYKVSVGIGQSLVVPILDREVPGRRIDLYQPSVDAQHPLIAVAITNDGTTALPPGVLTLYEQTADRGATYLGDARLSSLPIGDKRLVSYAVDGKVTVDRSSTQRRYLVKAAISGGVMHLSRLLRQTTNYQIKAAGDLPPLVVEHPRQAEWTLASPDPNSVEQTPTAYRIPTAFSGKNEGTLAVTEDRPLEETIRLVDLDDNRLGVLASSNELDVPTRKLIGEIAKRRQVVAQRRSDLDRLNKQRAQLVDDEKRFRDIIEPLGPDSALRKRTIERLGDTEKSIEALAGRIAGATGAVDAAQSDLENYVNGLTL